MQLIVTTFNGYCYYDILYFIPQFFQVTRGDSPLRAGVLLLPFVVTPGDPSDRFSSERD